MAVLHDAIYDLLDGVETDIYPDLAPDDDINTPYVVYSIISCVPNDDKDGVSGLDTYRIQFNVYHNDDRNLDVLANDIRTALDRQSGTYQSVVIQSIRFDNEFGGKDFNSKLYYRIQDYLFRIKK